MEHQIRFERLDGAFDWFDVRDCAEFVLLDENDGFIVDCENIYINKESKMMIYQRIHYQGADYPDNFAVCYEITIKSLLKILKMANKPLPADLAGVVGLKQSPRGGDTPDWYRPTKTIEYMDKRFSYKKMAENQFLLLDVFQEEGWPVSPKGVLNPFPPGETLKRTVDDFNSTARLIKFCFSNDEVYWQSRSDPPAPITA